MHESTDDPKIQKVLILLPSLHIHTQVLRTWRFDFSQKKLVQNLRISTEGFKWNTFGLIRHQTLDVPRDPMKCEHCWLVSKFRVMLLRIYSFDFCREDVNWKIQTSSCVFHLRTHSVQFLNQNHQGKRQWNVFTFYSCGHSNSNYSKLPGCFFHVRTKTKLRRCSRSLVEKTFVESFASECWFSDNSRMCYWLWFYSKKFQHCWYVSIFGINWLSS